MANPNFRPIYVPLALYDQIERMRWQIALWRLHGVSHRILYSTTGFADHSFGSLRKRESLSGTAQEFASSSQWTMRTTHSGLVGAGTTHSSSSAGDTVTRTPAPGVGLSGRRFNGARTSARTSSSS